MCFVMFYRYNTLIILKSLLPFYLFPFSSQMLPVSCIFLYLAFACKKRHEALNIIFRSIKFPINDTILMC